MNTFNAAAQLPFKDRIERAYSDVGVMPSTAKVIADEVINYLQKSPNSRTDDWLLNAAERLQDVQNMLRNIDPSFDNFSNIELGNVLYKQHFLITKPETLFKNGYELWPKFKDWFREEGQSEELAKKQFLAALLGQGSILRALPNSFIASAKMKVASLQGAFLEYKLPALKTAFILNYSRFYQIVTSSSETLKDQVSVFVGWHPKLAYTDKELAQKFLTYYHLLSLSDARFALFNTYIKRCVPKDKKISLSQLNDRAAIEKAVLQSLTHPIGEPLVAGSFDGWLAQTKRTEVPDDVRRVLASRYIILKALCEKGSFTVTKIKIDPAYAAAQSPAQEATMTAATLKERILALRAARAANRL